MLELLTIGHSTHTFERLLELLSTHSIGAVADVRSAPYSRHASHFNREPLAAALRRAEIEYVFLGNQLGARSTDPHCIVAGKVRFDRVARTSTFHHGLERLRQGMESYRIALLCAEKDPTECHRMILVCRALRSNGVRIEHILADGGLESNEDAERRLMRTLNIPESDLFLSAGELIDRAYDTQASRIAYHEKEGG
jgi:uncharacterized protein (DUF488 family)